MLLLALIAAPPLMLAQLYQEPKAPAPQGQPQLLRNIGIDQRLNAQTPLNAVFHDESGQPVQLGRYFGSKPVILAPVYYTCPMLCNEVQSGLASALAILKFNAGKEFNVVVFSINPHETNLDALKKKKQFMERYKRAGSDAGVHFLTGDQPSIDALTKAVGFRYNYDPKTGQYAHASGIMVLTPEGKIAQYFYGIEYAPTDLRLALVQSSAGKIGNPVDQVLLYCFHYDPNTGKYGAVVMNMVRLGGLVTVFGLGLFMLVAFRKEGKTKTKSIGSSH